MCIFFLKFILEKVLLLQVLKCNFKLCHYFIDPYIDMPFEKKEVFFNKIVKHLNSILKKKIKKILKIFSI